MTDVALKPSEVLAKAADLIEPEGCWWQTMRGATAQRQWVEPFSPMAVCWCVVGAVQVAAERRDDFYDPYEQPELAWVRSAVEYDGDIAMWNDDPGRTPAEVVAALRKASELARSEGQ